MPSQFALMLPNSDDMLHGEGGTACPPLRTLDLILASLIIMIGRKDYWHVSGATFSALLAGVPRALLNPIELSMANEPRSKPSAPACPGIACRPPQTSHGRRRCITKALEKCG